MSGCCSSVAEHWLHKARCPGFLGAIRIGDCEWFSLSGRVLASPLADGYASIWLMQHNTVDWIILTTLATVENSLLGKRAKYTLQDCYHVSGEHVFGGRYSLTWNNPFLLGWVKGYSLEMTTFDHFLLATVEGNFSLHSSDCFIV